MLSTKTTRALGPVLKAHLPAAYPAISRVAVPSLITRYKSSTAPSVKYVIGDVSPLSRFFDMNDDFFKPMLSRPTELMRLSKLIDAERVWFNQHYLNTLNSFNELDEMLPSNLTHFSSPGYQVSHDERNVEISVDLPHVNLEDVNVELTGDGKILHIYGGHKTESDGKIKELKLDKRLSLGEEIDKENLSAYLHDGRLTVTAPKLEVQGETALEENVKKIPLTSYDPSLDG